MSISNDTHDALLAEAHETIKDLVIALITVKGNLDKPYPDDPRWTPWQVWVERPFQRAAALDEQLRPITRRFGRVTA